MKIIYPGYLKCQGSNPKKSQSTKEIMSMTDEAFEIGKSIWEAQTCARSKRMTRRKEGVLVQGSSARAPGQGAHRQYEQMEV